MNVIIASESKMASSTGNPKRRANFFLTQRDAVSKTNGIVVKVQDDMHALLGELSLLFNGTIVAVYTIEGGRITNVDLIRDNDSLWVKKMAMERNHSPEETRREGSGSISGRSSRISDSSSLDFSLKPCTSGPITEDASSRSDWVKLNVGGKVFATTRATLTADPESMLARMFSTEDTLWHSATDSTGAYLFDRSPDFFDPILNFLRHGKLILNTGINPEGVLEEAKFFGISKAIELLEAMIENDRLSSTGRLSRKEFLTMIGRTSSSSVLRCQGIDLRGIDLSYMDLQNINMKNADLRCCNLTGANLINCCLERANMEGAVLDEAKLQCVEMTKATLDHASLKCCNFDKRLGNVTQMVGASCKGAVFDGSQMNGIDMRLTSCKGASFKGCSLRDANLAATDLESCDFTGSDLHDTNLRGANLKDTNFENISGPGLHMSQTLNLTGGQGGRYRNAERENLI